MRPTAALVSEPGTRSDDHRVRLLGQDGRDVGRGSQPDLDARVDGLVVQPVDVQPPALAAPSLSGEPGPAAKDRTALEDDDAVAAQRRRSSGLEARDPATHHDDSTGMGGG